MDSFILVNLDTQFEAFKEYTNGWKANEILDLMSKFGTLSPIELPQYALTFYVFRSTSGWSTAFRFSEDDRLVIVQPK